MRAVVDELGLDIIKQSVASSEGTSNEEVSVCFRYLILFASRYIWVHL